MELMMSPIFGLMMVVVNRLTEIAGFSLPRDGVREKKIFKCSGNPQTWGDFYGTSSLFYKGSTQLHPP
jgi:hypothetical protein